MVVNDSDKVQSVVTIFIYFWDTGYFDTDSDNDLYPGFLTKFLPLRDTCNCKICIASGFINNSNDYNGWGRAALARRFALSESYYRHCFTAHLCAAF